MEKTDQGRASLKPSYEKQKMKNHKKRAPSNEYHRKIQHNLNHLQ